MRSSASRATVAETPAAAGGDELARRPLGVDAGVAAQPRQRGRVGPQAGGAVDQLLVREAAGAGDMAGVRGAGLAQEQVARPRVDQRGAAPAGVVDLGQGAAQQRTWPRGKRRRRAVGRRRGHRAALVVPGRPAAVEHAGLHAVGPERPGHAGGEDPVVVVVGDHEVVGVDAQRTRARGERAGVGELHRDGVAGIDEVVLPVDEGRAGEVRPGVLGPLRVRQGRARMAAADIEDADAGVLVMRLEPLGGDEGTVGDLRHGSCSLGLFGHGDQVLAGDLADQFGVIGAHVHLDHCGRVLHGLALSEEPTLAADDLRHDLSFACGTTVRLPGCRVLRFSLQQP